MAYKHIEPSEKLREILEELRPVDITGQDEVDFSRVIFEVKEAANRLGYRFTDPTHLQLRKDKEKCRIDNTMALTFIRDAAIKLGLIDPKEGLNTNPVFGRGLLKQFRYQGTEL
jgi:allophanate hydrolase subunit 2